MRLLLDANLSSKRIGDPLGEQGHDVRGLATEPDLEGLDDERVLELATTDGHISITRTSRDFAPSTAPLGRSRTRTRWRNSDLVFHAPTSHREHRRYATVARAAPGRPPLELTVRQQLSLESSPKSRLGD